ncbi:MAG TPA: D-galactonate dehydratase family protein [Spirochaetia bacterium]|nr:D-galactonate dehydratase family protein [Spirochaetia bacterium]
MTITDVRVIATCPGRNYVLLKILTDQGVYGVGDITLNGRELAVAELVERYIAPLLIGRDPDRIEDTWQYLSRGSYWRGGPIQMTAIAGIDCALWDIKGKVAGLPVYSLLGGKTRESALCYTHCAGRDISEVKDAISRALEMGFRAVRAQCSIPGIGSTYGQGGQKEAALATWGEPGGLPFVEEWEPGPYLRFIPKLMDQLRSSFENVELLHDVHERLNPIQACTLARELEPCHLFFLEDPLRPEHRESLRLLRRHTVTPLATSELYTTKWDCLLPITEQLIDFIRCDLGHCGGITEGRKIAAIAEPYAVQTAWHGPGDISPVMHAANVHLDISTPNFGIQEMVFFPEQVREVISGGPTFEDGSLRVGDTPGLGVDINESAAKKYPYIRA